MTDVNDSFRYCMQIYAHPFLPAWLNHCRLNLFLQMLSLNKLWKKDSLKRRDMVKESWAYYTPKSCLGGLMLCIWYVQTRWSPPCDLGTINKHIKELNHKFALHIDSSWLVAFQHLYVNTKDLPWERMIHAACHWPQMDEKMDENSIRGSSEASSSQDWGSENSQKWDVDIHGSVTIICVI